MPGLKDICIDWWAPLLGYRVRPWTNDDLARLAEQGLSGPTEDPSVAADPPEGPDGMTVWFLKVPEPKVAKNRVHLDLWGDADAIVASGATLIAKLPKWTVLADPEGNEFCVFAQ
jgi:hypothetical protein